MKREVVHMAIVLMAVGTVSAWGGGSCCGAKKAEGTKGACAKSEQADKSGAGVAASRPQANCPVMGGPARKDVYVDHGGKRIYLCCGACVDAFKADPEKYLKKLAGEGVELEAVPVTD